MAAGAELGAAIGTIAGRPGRWAIAGLAMSLLAACSWALVTHAV